DGFSAQIGRELQRVGLSLGPDLRVNVPEAGELRSRMSAAGRLGLRYIVRGLSVDFTAVLSSGLREGAAITAGSLAAAAATAPFPFPWAIAAAKVIAFKLAYDRVKAIPDPRFRASFDVELNVSIQLPRALTADGPNLRVLAAEGHT